MTVMKVGFTPPPRTATVILYHVYRFFPRLTGFGKPVSRTLPSSADWWLGCGSPEVDYRHLYPCSSDTGGQASAPLR